MLCATGLALRSGGLLESTSVREHPSYDPSAAIKTGGGMRSLVFGVETGSEGFELAFAPPGLPLALMLTTACLRE